jgi:hypothetical protein
MLSVATDVQAHDGLRLDLDELVREGARRMLAVALEAEVDADLAAHLAERDEGGRRLVVRNGHARQREVLTAAGAIWCGRRGWMTAARIWSPANGSASARCSAALVPQAPQGG